MNFHDVHNQLARDGVTGDSYNNYWVNYLLCL